MKSKILNSRIDIDNVLYTGIDWAKAYKEEERFHKTAMDMMKAEMFQSQFNLEQYRSDGAEKWAEMVPIHKRGVDLSLPGIMSCLSHAKEHYFTLEDGYGPNSNPFERMNLYTGYFGGLQIEERDLGERWENTKHLISGTVSLPYGTPWSVFYGLSQFVDRHHRPHDSVSQPPRGGSLLHLLDKHGWFNKEHTDIFFQAEVAAKNIPSWRQNYGSKKYSNHERYVNEDWDLISTSMHIGPWRFSQDYRLRSGSFQGPMRNLGWDDQIIISKELGKQLENIILYLDPTGRRSPRWEIYREEELRSHIEGDTWTDNDLRLLEMLDLRDEVFLDKPKKFPILSGIGQVTKEFLQSEHEIRRSEIRSIFGKGTIKIGDIAS